MTHNTVPGAAPSQPVQYQAHQQYQAQPQQHQPHSQYAGQPAGFQRQPSGFRVALGVWVPLIMLLIIIAHYFLHPLFLHHDVNSAVGGRRHPNAGMSYGDFLGAQFNYIKELFNTSLEHAVGEIIFLCLPIFPIVCLLVRHVVVYIVTGIVFVFEFFYFWGLTFKWVLPGYLKLASHIGMYYMLLILAVLGVILCFAASKPRRSKTGNITPVYGHSAQQQHYGQQPPQH
ncbi:MAG: hypothetical protein Q4C71_02430 [Microbacteriaceae bacterium]|nr:hypothetical protein [Microbacteriaceae bacterium]